MIKDALNINYAWMYLCVEEFVRWGVTAFFIAPGSRSTPLTTTIARHKATDTIVHFDERGTAFAALGYAKATGLPAVWVTTSGTAVANGLPAVIEALLDNVPLILLTADRPHELRQTGANQTIPQANLFTPYVKWAVDASPPSVDIPAPYVLTTIDQAVHQALSDSQGPVHINWMFREPLEPVSTELDLDHYLSSIDNWITSTNKFTTYPTTKKVAELVEVTELYNLAFDSQKGLVIAGRLQSKKEGEAAKYVAELLNWPFFADISSQVRLGQQDSLPGSTLLSPLFFDLYDSDRLNAPETIIQFGKRPTSKRLLKWIEDTDCANYIVVDPFSNRLDPIHKVSHRVEANVLSFCNGFLEVHIKKKRTSTSSFKEWSAFNEKVINRSDLYWLENTTLSEPRVARLISNTIGENHGFVIGNSMPIRDTDSYGSYSGNWTQVITNRGASGIDGIIATAVGFAYGKNNPVTVLIGDLGFLHDLNSLAMVKGLSTPFIIVVINNDGGGIFSFLPIAQYEDVFETFFGTPHGFTFESAAKLFDFEYYAPNSIEEFQASYKKALSQKSASLIEVTSSKSENVAVHKALLDYIRKDKG